MDLAKLKDLKDWHKIRNDIRDKIIAVLGKFPDEKPEPQMKVLDEDSFDGYVRKKITYFVDEWERPNAWFFMPDGKDDVPAILCCHQMTPFGKNEPAGIEGDPNLAFAKHYAELGYATLAPDCITAGERISFSLEPYDTSSFYKDHPGMSAMGKMLWDHMIAVDVLCEMRRVDSARIGVIGHSLGGHNALMLAAFDERIQACVASCAFTRFADDKTPDRWARPNGFVYMPKLAPAIKKKKYPFDWEHVLALIAPNPTLLLTALNDECFSNTESCETAVEMAKKIYRLLSVPNGIHIETHNEGHKVTPELLEKADDWFERWL
ncbi:MAG TPA: prolyl oligopeptidase family serine peptidase [Candidatus Hydrogenedentes bacterium]|nr:prolyl oligopeptidase family serine peptidase [Candidatus Hydrogenedentota bacterium]HOL76365.1 prolyl oligopeptidase family serine peptidase [Candidatus Hydrogenedentota bacterium]HPO85403.1 prolyl oligopeptidase family serine peptidase [Candidatus Hydrogenedentota bacterium]